MVSKATLMGFISFVENGYVVVRYAIYPDRSSY